jgi:hypothetical protein
MAKAVAQGTAFGATHIVNCGASEVAQSAFEGFLKAWVGVTGIVAAALAAPAPSRSISLVREWQ